MSNGEQFATPQAPPTTVVVSDVTDHELDNVLVGTATGAGMILSGLIEHFFGVNAAAIVDGTAVVTAIQTGAWDKIMTVAGRFFKTAQGEQNSTFYDLCAAILTDLTGVEIDPVPLKQSAFGSGRVAGMEKFGSDLYDMLAKEFAPQSGDLEAPSDAPAKIFLGFLMNFAIRQGNVSAMCEALPSQFKFLEGFRDYGELMAKNLGLGRLARRALTPLIQTLVAEPLQNKLNADYRPKRMAKEQAIKAYFRGEMQLPQLRKELAEEGYSETRQDLMIYDARPLVSDRDVIRLYFQGRLNETDRDKYLTARGYDANSIFLMVEATRPQLTVADILELHLFGAMQDSDATDALSKLGYDATTAAQIVQASTLRHDPSKRTQPLHIRTRTINQLRKEFLDGVINLGEWNTAVTQMGYSQDDISALQLDLLLDQQGRRATRATRAVPSLTWAQLKAAFKSGVVDLEEVKVHLTHRGYSADDIAVLVKELSPPPASTATPTA